MGAPSPASDGSMKKKSFAGVGKKVAGVAGALSFLQHKSHHRRARCAELLRKPSKMRSDEDIQQLEELLRPVKFLQHMPVQLRRSLCGLAKYKSLPQHGWLFHEGDAGDSFYVIISGRVSVMKWNENTKKLIQISFLQTGSYFGEIALQDEANKRTAGIQAMEDCEFLMVTRDDYNRILRKIMAEDQRERLGVLQGIHIFRDMKHADLQALAGVLSIKSFAPNAVIAREGTEADELFIVKRGGCRVVKAVTLEAEPEPERVVADAARLSQGELGPIDMWRDHGVMVPLPPWKDEEWAAESEERADFLRGDASPPEGGGGGSTEGRRRGREASARARGGRGERNPGGAVGGEPQGGPGGRRSGGEAEDGSASLSVCAPSMHQLRAGYTGNSALLRELFDNSRVGPTRPAEDSEAANLGRMRRELRSMSVRRMPAGPESGVGGGGSVSARREGGGSEVVRLPPLPGGSMSARSHYHARRRRDPQGAGGEGGGGGGGTKRRYVRMMLEVGSLSAGEFFGEVGSGTSSSRGSRRRFSVIAQKETEVYVLNRFDFYRRLSPETLRAVDAIMEEFCDPGAIFSAYMSSMRWEAYKSALVAGVLGMT